MQQFKRFLKEVLIYSAIGVVLSFGLMYLSAHIEKKDCLCSILTVEEKSYPIDERLSRVIDPNTVNSGTFAIFTTFCDHRVRMRLTVYPDAGTYTECLLDSNVQESSIQTWFTKPED
jgi:hypothetical protein